MFSYKRRVQFYETDLMAIVHHSNYLRFFEEARVAWATQKGVLEYKNPQAGRTLAVVETSCQHLKPCVFGDELDVQLQVRLDGVRVFFQYKIINLTQNMVSAIGRTVHVSVDDNMKLLRPTEKFKALLAREEWTETWP